MSVKSLDKMESTLETGRFMLPSRIKAIAAHRACDASAAFGSHTKCYLVLPIEFVMDFDETDQLLINGYFGCCLAMRNTISSANHLDPLAQQ